MRCFVFFTLITVSFCSKIQPKSVVHMPEKDIKEVLQTFNVHDIPSIKPNELVDRIVEYINDFLVHNGADPLELPDIRRNISYKPFWINYHGDFELTKGWLQDISTMHREGDVNLVYNFASKKYEAFIPLAFEDIMFNYSYKAKIMDIGPIGEAMGKISNLKLKLYLSYDNITRIRLHDFDITDTGHFSLRFIGNDMADWLVNLLTETTSYILHPVIIRLVQNTIRPYMEEIVKVINAIMDHNQNTDDFNANHIPLL